MAPRLLTRRELLLSGAVLPLAAARTLAQAPPDDAEALAQIRQIEAQLGGARLGIAALNLDTGRRLRYQSEEPYPMWSTYKIPIALSVLKRVEAGSERLDRMVTVEPRFFSSGSGILTDFFSHGALALSVRNLLELMIVVSDNTATAILLESVGGGAAVTADLRALGVTGIRVDLPNMQRAARLLPNYTLPPKEQWSAELAGQVNEAVGAVQPGTPGVGLCDEGAGGRPAGSGQSRWLRLALLQALVPAPGAEAVPAKPWRSTSCGDAGATRSGPCCLATWCWRTSPEAGPDPTTTSACWRCPVARCWRSPC